MEDKEYILITGVAGLLGNHFYRYLLDKGYNVIGIDDFSGSYPDLLSGHPNFTLYSKKIGEDDISFIFKKHNIKTVYHFAAYAAEGLSPFIRKYNYNNNVIASVDVINNCINHDCKMVFTSSMAVYGSQKAPFTEDMTPKPIDPYGIAKYCVEMDINEAFKQFGMRYTIIRPHNVLGIYQNIWDKYRNVIGIFIRKAIKREPLLVYGDGNQTRAFSDIKYYMNPFLSVLEEHNNEIFNIGADNYFTINHVANLVKDIASDFNINVDIRHEEPRHEVKHAYCDHTKAKSKLQFNDETDLKVLILEMFSWAINQPDRSVKLMDYEVSKNIYSYWL